MSNAMRISGKAGKMLESRERQVANLREKLKKGGNVARRTIVGGVASGLAGYIGERFVRDEGEVYPAIHGVPFEPVLGAIALGAGFYANSPTMTDAGIGILIGSAHSVGANLANLQNLKDKATKAPSGG